MTSSCMREDELFMRNKYVGQGRWNIPLVRKQAIDIEQISLIAYSDTRKNDDDKNRKSGVHFFVDDYRFEGIYFHPKNSLSKLSQYAFLLTPDFSLYSDMATWRQVENVAKNRWVGAYWQEHGLLVIPTISWSTPSSFGFCFDGVEKNSIVAVGMIGCRHEKLAFMRGYNAMLEHIQPEAIVCFGSPFSEMEGNIISVDYRLSRRVVR